MADAVFSIAHAGPLVSVQDGGRPGLMRFGVPASGAMDRLSFAAAQVAAGNPAGAAAIEVSRGGLTLDCIAGSVSCAVAGGGFILSVAAGRWGSWQVVRISAGQRLTIRPGPWGSWTYLAFAGALQVQHWLGSAATHGLSGLGGGAIVTGGQIVVAEAASDLRQGAIICPVTARPRPVLHVVPGPQDRFFDAAALAAFLGQDFALTDAADRMGVRLRGPLLPPQGALGIPSEPIVRGSVQVAGDGVATVLLADHQTTGGYPRIATVIDADLDGFAQLRPRDRVRFRAITPAAAVAVARSRALAQTRYMDGLAATWSGRGT